MKITLEKHAYQVIEVDPDKLSPQLRQQLEQVTHDDNYEDLFDQLIEEAEDCVGYDDYDLYETVVELDNDKDIIWETIGV